MISCNDIEEVEARNRAGWYFDYSVVHRQRESVDVHGYESHAEAAKEDDQVLTGDGHEGPKASVIRNVTNACSVAA